MKNKASYLIIVSLLLSIQIFSQQNYVSKVWVADNGDGTYHNPVLYSDYSDPDAIRVGSDYYMTASSFNCTPGLPILHSKDLVNWRIINYALKKQIPEDVSIHPNMAKEFGHLLFGFIKMNFIFFIPIQNMVFI